MLEWYTDCLLKSLLIQVLHDVEPCSLSPHSRTKLNQLCICSADDCTAGQNVVAAELRGASTAVYRDLLPTAI